MKKIWKFASLAFIAFFALLMSGITNPVMAQDEEGEANRFLSLLDVIDITRLEVGETTMTIHIGNGQWETITINVTESDGENPLPRWWCCWQPWMVQVESASCGCNRQDNFNNCYSFWRSTVDACWTCGSIFYETSRYVSLPGCFFEFYGELGWRFPTAQTHIHSGYALTRNFSPLAHQGIDIIHPAGEAATIGVPVFAAHSGWVVIAQADNATAGNWVVIDSGVRDIRETNNFIVSRYLHLQNKPIPRQDTYITQGMQIGNIGNTGSVNSNTGLGYHLHMDVNNVGRNDNAREHTINPQRFFPFTNFTGQSNRNSR
jgi:hypothetical protein